MVVYDSDVARRTTDTTPTVVIIERYSLNEATSRATEQVPSPVYEISDRAEVCGTFGRR